MIIVEGVDGSGKTTLIRQLKEVIPELQPLPSPFKIYGWEHYYMGCIEYLEMYQEDKTAIVDRFFFSELVFGPIRRQELMSLSKITYLESRISSLRVPVIWCDPPIKAIEDHINDQPQFEDVLKNIRMASLLYRSVMSMYRGKMFRYDWTDRNSFNYLLEFLGRKQ